VKLAADVKQNVMEAIHVVFVQAAVLTVSITIIVLNVKRELLQMRMKPWIALKID
jgi:hypothetical protein